MLSGPRVAQLRPQLRESSSRVDASEPFVVQPIGIIRSPLRTRADAPDQGAEGAPGALLDIDPAFLDALHGIRPGDELILLTWLHLAGRSVLRTHPRGDTTIPLTGVGLARRIGRPRSASTASPSSHSRARRASALTRWRRSTAHRSSTSRSPCPTCPTRERSDRARRERRVQSAPVIATRTTEPPRSHDRRHRRGRARGSAARAVSRGRTSARLAIR